MPDGLNPHRIVPRCNMLPAQHRGVSVSFNGRNTSYRGTHMACNAAVAEKVEASPRNAVP